MYQWIVNMTDAEFHPSEKIIILIMIDKKVMVYSKRTV